MMEKPTRINKFISGCTALSRRKVDEYILQGRITINGYTIYDPGYIINPAEHKVAVDGELIRASMRKIYILMNKPTKVITAVSDDKGRPTVMDVLGERLNVFPVGRLDYDTSGFLILTNDGDLANELMNPKFKVTKTYEVTLSKPLDNKHRLLLMKGIVLDGYKTRPCYINLKGKFSTNTVFITLVEGKNRQVRRMFEHFGYFVNKLERIKYGHMKLGSLETGQWRYLSTEEVNNLRKVIENGINENFMSTEHLPKKVQQAAEPVVTEVLDVKEAEEKPKKTTKAKKSAKTEKEVKTEKADKKEKTDKKEKAEKAKKETKTKKTTSRKSKKNEEPEIEQPETEQPDMEEQEKAEPEIINQEDEEINVDAIDYFDEDDDFNLVSEEASASENVSAPEEINFNKKLPKESVEVDDYGEVNFNRIENFLDDGNSNLFLNVKKPSRKLQKGFNKIDTEVDGNKLLPGEVQSKGIEKPENKGSRKNSEDEINFNRIENNDFEKVGNFSRKNSNFTRKGNNFTRKSSNSTHNSGNSTHNSGNSTYNSGNSTHKTGNSSNKAGNFTHKAGNFKKKEGSFAKRDYEFKRVEINPVKKDEDSGSSTKAGENFNKKENNFNREGFNVVYTSDSNKWKSPQPKKPSFSKPHSNSFSKPQANSKQQSKSFSKQQPKGNQFKQPSKLPGKIANVVQTPKYTVDENGEKNFNTMALDNASNIMNFYEKEKKYKNIYEYEQRTERPGKKKTGGTRGAKRSRR